jgi:serine/threonine protein kinase
MDKEYYSEKEAADTIRPIIDAIKYCHSLNIIHRDIKVQFTTLPLVFNLLSPSIA